jgi:stage V sporulation protein AE
VLFCIDYIEKEHNIDCFHQRKEYIFVTCARQGGSKVNNREDKLYDKQTRSNDIHTHPSYPPQSIREVILITDGDCVASSAVQKVAQEIGGRCISRSTGNPTLLTGDEIVECILQTPYDPVLVMFDDNGRGDRGEGERALQYVAQHPAIRVIGAIAVASNTEKTLGTHVDVGIDADGHIVHRGVDKDGKVEMSAELRVYGDTVDILDQLPIPFIVGIGDIGKMRGKDRIDIGAPITKKAVDLILDRSGYHERKSGERKKETR